MAPKALEYNATLVERVDVTDALTMFRIEPDQMPAELPWFVPGQYCVLGANNQATCAAPTGAQCVAIGKVAEAGRDVIFAVHFAKGESEIGDQVDARNHLNHREIAQRR